MKNAKILKAFFVGLLVLIVPSFFSSCTPDSEFMIEEHCYCEKTAPSFYPNWDGMDTEGNYVYYWYEITDAPKGFKEQVGGFVYYIAGNNQVGTMWYKSKKSEILDALKKNEFGLYNHYDNQKIIVLDNVRNTK